MASQMNGGRLPRRLLTCSECVPHAVCVGNVGGLGGGSRRRGDISRPVPDTVALVALSPAASVRGGVGVPADAMLAARPSGPTGPSLDFIKEKSHKYYGGNKKLTNSKYRREVDVSQGTLLRQQAAIVEKHGLETLLFCPDAWALRHRFINRETGEMIR